MKSRNQNVGRFAVHKGGKHSYEARRIAIRDMNEDPEINNAWRLSILGKDGASEALPHCEVLDVERLESNLTFAPLSQTHEVDLSGNKHNSAERDQLFDADQQISIKSLLVLTIADIDIFLLKCPDQETDRRDQLTVDQIRKQLYITMIKMCKVMDLAYDIERPIPSEKVMFDTPPVLPNKLPNELKYKLQFDL